LELTTYSNCKKEFISLLTQNAGSRDKWQVFCDFVELAAIAISNQCDYVHRDEREERYLQHAGGYTRPEMDRFCSMLSCVFASSRLTEDEPKDFLGEIYHELELHNKWKGQFFTPMHICTLMAEFQMADAENALTTKPYITVNDPCSGSGALLLGYASAMKRHKIDYQTKLRAVATDIDLKCVHMAYIQLALYGIPAVIIHGNSLTVEEWSHWFTPALFRAVAAEERPELEAVSVTA